MKNNTDNAGKQELKLVRWVNANCPPIDLNLQAIEIVRLAEAYKALKEQLQKEYQRSDDLVKHWEKKDKENKELREALQKFVTDDEINGWGYNPDHIRQAKQALNNTKEVS